MPKVWKIAPGGNAWFWEECRKRGFIAINWLNNLDLTNKSRDDLKKALTRAGDKIGGAVSIWPFVNEVREKDIVVANDGMSRVVGIGVVNSPYLPPDDPRNPNKRDEENRQTRLVDWRIVEPVDSGKSPFFNVRHTVWQLAPEHCERLKKAYLKQHPELKEC